MVVLGSDPRCVTGNLGKFKNPDVLESIRGHGALLASCLNFGHTQHGKYFHKLSFLLPESSPKPTRIFGSYTAGIFGAVGMAGPIYAPSTNHFLRKVHIVLSVGVTQTRCITCFVW